MVAGGFVMFVTSIVSSGETALGCGVGVLQSSQAGYEVYKKLGFEDVGGVAFYLRMPE